MTQHQKNVAAFIEKHGGYPAAAKKLGISTPSLQSFMLGARNYGKTAEAIGRIGAGGVLNKTSSAPMAEKAEKPAKPKAKVKKVAKAKTKAKVKSKAKTKPAKAKAKPAKSKMRTPKTAKAKTPRATKITKAETNGVSAPSVPTAASESPSEDVTEAP
jgi:hypothetical protein